MKRSRFRNRVHLRGGADGVVSQAGIELLYRAARGSGLDRALSAELAGHRMAGSEHDPGKVVLDLAVMLASGGDCPADTAMLRGRQEVFGPVASDPTISRLVHRLAADPDGPGALRRAAAAARGTAADHLPGPAGEVLVDIDGTLITAHSEKQDATPTYKRGFGFHPLLAYADHGAGGTGEPVAGLLRPGNANAGTAADHEAVLDLLEAQAHRRRAGGAGGAHRHRRLHPRLPAAAHRPGPRLHGRVLRPRRCRRRHRGAARRCVGAVHRRRGGSGPGRGVGRRDLRAADLS